MQKIDVKKIFGKSVRSWRNLLGISQEELAERSDLHRTYISDVERGTRNLSLQSIQRLAQALDVSVSALFLKTEAASQKLSAGKGQLNDMADILLVEDNPDDVALTMRAFELARFTNRIQIVSDGAEALDYVFCKGKYASRPSSEQPNVILLDLKPPKISGLEVLRCIKADKRTREIPVVILTVSDDNYDIAECRRLGAENYIVKPVDFQRLSRATPQLNLNWALLKPIQKEKRKITR